MNRCAHCDEIIEDPARKRFCSNWCAKDYKQPEDNKSWPGPNLQEIKDGVYNDEAK